MHNFNWGVAISNFSFVKTKEFEQKKLIPNPRSFSAYAKAEIN
jgi:hypothetical protein